MRSPRLLLAVLLTLAVPASATAGTVTVGYPDATTMALTGTADPESFWVRQDSFPGGSPAFLIYVNSGTTVAPGAGCEAGPYAGSFLCPRSGVTLIEADLGDGGDNLDTYDLGATTTLDADMGAGNDLVQGSQGADTIDGGAGNDDVIGRPGNDTLDGGDGDDRVLGDDGNDALDGGVGTDRLYGGYGDDTQHGGDGDDEVWGYDGTDQLFGDEGADRLWGDGNGGPAPAADALDGGAGDDTMDGGPGTNTYTGGAGTDTVSYAGSSTPVNVSLDGVANDGAPGQNENVDADRVVGSSQADTLTGDSGPNTLDGNGGPDSISGAGGDDTLNGGSGDDTFLAESGADSYEGGGYDVNGDTLSYAARTPSVTVRLDDTANDGAAGENDNVKAMTKVIGGRGADVMQGGATNDTFDGGPGADTVKGGAGDDLLAGGAGADTIDGEAGINTVDYSARTDAVTVDLAEPATDGAPGEGDVLSNFRGIRGGSGNDVLKLAPPPEGSSDVTANRAIAGGPGNDTLTGTDAVDDLRGGAGNDTINALDGGDRLVGGEGADTLNGGDGSDLMFGDVSEDPAFGESGATQPGDGNDTLNGGDGADQMGGAGGNDTLDGGGWDDRMWGGSGADTFRGGDGKDQVSYEYRIAAVAVTIGAGARDDGNALDGPAGARDSLAADTEYVRGSQSADALTGGAGDDTLYGLGGDDALHAKGGDDTLSGGDAGGSGDGADVLDGGPGTDTVTYGADSWWSCAVNVSLDGVANDGCGTEAATGTAKDDVVGIEHVIGSVGSDTITGSGAAETFEGWSGNDTITAGGGADRIIGGTGADTITAGDGDDTIGTGYYDPAAPTYGYTDGARDTVDAGPGDDLLVSNDRGAGAQGNVLEGGDGADTLTFDGEYEPVRVDEDGVADDGVINSGGGDNVTGFEVLAGGSGNDQLSGGGAAQVLDGQGGNDTLSGGAADETLRGGDGDDAVDGGEGDDVLDGGAGNDALAGGAGTDRISYAERSRAVTVSLDGVANDGDPTVAEKDNVAAEIVAGGDGADTLLGSAGRDVLRGGGGNDALDGAAGDDTVDGGPGRDALTSGAGTDTLLARDDEADTLTCDTRDAKTVEVDAAMDAFTTCADPATVDSGSPGSGFTPSTPPPAGTVTEPPDQPGDRPASQTPGRRAEALLKALKPRRKGHRPPGGRRRRRRARACSKTPRCTVRARLMIGKKLLALGTVSGARTVKATVSLTKAGRRALGRRSPLAREAHAADLRGRLAGHADPFLRPHPRCPLDAPPAVRRPARLHAARGRDAGRRRADPARAAAGHRRLLLQDGPAVVLHPQQLLLQHHRRDVVLQLAAHPSRRRVDVGADDLGVGQLPRVERRGRGPHDHQHAQHGRLHLRRAPVRARLLHVHGGGLHPEGGASDRRLAHARLHPADRRRRVAALRAGRLLRDPPARHVQHRRPAAQARSQDGQGDARGRRRSDRRADRRHGQVRHPLQPQRALLGPGRRGPLPGPHG